LLEGDGHILPYGIAGLIGCDAGEALWRGLKACEVAGPDTGEKSHGLAFKLVRQAGPGEALGGNLGGNVKPYRQVRLTNKIRL
jgi:hypothetical protein